MMRFKFYFALLLLFPVFGIKDASAQGFDYQLTGNPVDITGWEMGTQSSINGDHIELTQPIESQAGYIYYTTPSTLTECSQFTVTFEFSITNSSFPTADGIAFWYIQNPPTGFTEGGGIGLPNNPNGLLLILDTYNNNGFPDDNPLVSLRLMDGTSNYTEGINTGQIVPDVTYQSFIANGNWHTCTLTYYYGDISVAFDGNPPLMTGNVDLSGLNGYFGFSAGTGASYALQSIRNVSILGAPIPSPPGVEDVTYCLNETASPLTADGNNLHWYTEATGGTELPSAPTPVTNTPGTFTWYVSQEITGCNIESARAEINVIVSNPPEPPTVNYQPTYCMNEDFIPFVVNGSNPLWYTEATGGVGTPDAPEVNTTTPGTYTWYVSQTVNGCESIERTPVNVVVYPAPEAGFDYVVHYGCSQDTVVFSNTSINSDSYVWNFGDNGPISNAVNPTHIFTAQGFYNVKLLTQSNNCYDSLMVQIDLNHPLAADFYVSDDTVCAQSAVTFTNFSVTDTVNGTLPQFYWDLGDGNSATGSSTFSHSYDNAGVYTVNLIITDGVPCRDTATHVIVVDPFAEINILQSDSLICTGDQITFTADYTPFGLEYLKWEFSDNNDTVIDVNPVVHAYDQPGNFEVNITGYYRSCPNVTAQTILAVNPMPIVNLGNDDSLCFHGEPIVLIDSNYLLAPDARWMWSTGDTTNYLVVRHHGEYRATVTIGGCSTTEEVKIYKDCYIDIPNSFTPNNDGVNDYFFPRQFLSEGIVKFQLQIFNRWGELVYDTRNTDGRGWDGRLNGKDQPMGVYVYIIDVTTKNGRVEHYTGNVTLLR